MDSIARTFLLAPSLRKWVDYNAHFRSFFEGRNPGLDALLARIEAFHVRHDAVPNLEALDREATSANDRDLLQYIQRVAAEQSIPVYVDETAFVAAVDGLKQNYHVLDIDDVYRRYKQEIGTGKGLYREGLEQARTNLLGALHQAGDRFSQDDEAMTFRLYGEAAVRRLQDRYDANEAQRLNDTQMRYSLPFEYFRDIRISAGDFISILGFTSQGKSVLARAICYHLLTHYQRNVAFWTLEMSAEDVEDLFAIQHANNKRIFPGTPKIPFGAYQDGALTPEQRDFLFDVAHPDLMKNEAYGTLYIEQPTREEFNMGDLAQSLATVESTFMPVHVVCPDYLPLMHPLPHGSKLEPDRSHFNKMVKQFRQLCLTHTYRGRKAPLVGISPFQISRGKYSEAVKAEGIYGPDAASDFNEVERSSRVMLSVFMDKLMKQNYRLRIQCLKNGKGNVPLDPYDVHCDLPFGMGLSEFAPTDEAEFEDRLQHLEGI